jgi:hypothetical protein
MYLIDVCIFQVFLNQHGFTAKEYRLEIPAAYDMQWC